MSKTKLSRLIPKELAPEEILNTVIDRERIRNMDFDEFEISVITEEDLVQSRYFCMLKYHPENPGEAKWRRSMWRLVQRSAFVAEHQGEVVEEWQIGGRFKFSKSLPFNFLIYMAGQSRNLLVQKIPMYELYPHIFEVSEDDRIEMEKELLTPKEMHIACSEFSQYQTTLNRTDSKSNGSS